MKCIVQIVHNCFEKYSSLVYRMWRVGCKARWVMDITWSGYILIFLLSVPSREMFLDWHLSAFFSVIWESLSLFSNLSVYYPVAQLPYLIKMEKPPISLVAHCSKPKLLEKVGKARKLFFLSPAPPLLRTHSRFNFSIKAPPVQRLLLCEPC